MFLVILFSSQLQVRINNTIKNVFSQLFSSFQFSHNLATVVHICPLRLAFSGIEMAITYSGFAGDLLEITCNITGPSLPSFEWRNESKILSLTTRVKIENNDQVSKLSVRKTTKSDSGSYHCIARLVHFIFIVACRTTIFAMKLTICHVAISFCIISVLLSLIQFIFRVA